MGSTSFVDSFVVKEFHEDLWMIFNFLMLTNPQSNFAMFSLCYTQHSSYLFRIMFPSLCILQDYIKFDTHTITMLEKLLGAQSFGGSISHLTRRQAIFLASSSESNLPFVVWIISLAFFEC